MISHLNSLFQQNKHNNINKQKPYNHDNKTDDSDHFQF